VIEEIVLTLKLAYGLMVIAPTVREVPSGRREQYATVFEPLRGLVAGHIGYGPAGDIDAVNFGLVWIRTEMG